MGLVGAVQFVYRGLQGIPVIQTVVLLECFGQGISHTEGQNAGAAAAEHSLFDLELELVGAVAAVLNEVVGHVLEDRIGPQQILSADRGAVSETGIERKDIEKRIRQIAIQI